MRAVVVYESMYGNTHQIATAVADGLRAVTADVAVVAVTEATPDVVAGADLVVAGGPTHAHGMSRRSTRKAAVDAAAAPSGTALAVEPGAQGPGLREWLSGLAELTAVGAAFDTRIKAPAAITGRASKGIGKELSRHGAVLVAPSESFFVTKDNRLHEGEEDRARRWGEELARGLSGAAYGPPRAART